MKYTLRKKLWCIKQMQKGITSVSEISRNRKIPRKTLYRWLDSYNKFGESGLHSKPRGAKPTEINPKFEGFLIKFWHHSKYGGPKMKIELDKLGFTVSQRQIQKIYTKNELKMNKRKRPNQIKFRTYEWPEPNNLWHTDWTTCPFTKKQMIAFIDDHSRFVVHAEFFENATTENTILAFSNAIAKFGRPQHVLTDNGTQFTPARAEKGPFTKWCEERGIKHILGRVHRPQTNGKIERWFGTYKQEYDERFACLDDFLHFYNYERIHQAIKYLKPIERYLQKCDINAV